MGVYAKKAQLEVCKDHLKELEQLALSSNIGTVAVFACHQIKQSSAHFLQKGKIEEIGLMLIEKEADCVILDDEISPAQQRNLEKLFKMPVIDRTEIILEIFAARARTKEARLQVSLAKSKYMFPRLKRLWGHFSRQRSTGGFLKGEGEKQLELDRRMLKDRIAKLGKQIKEIKKERDVQKKRMRRGEMPVFVIVGYTNAGKSTLLNALTKADVFAEDKLFATLDPTTRCFSLPNHQKILLTDTVGFVRKLPHTLVAAFKSTLEAALDHDCLIHVIDVSHPSAEEQAATTYLLLEQIGIKITDIITVLNKIDKCTDMEMVERLKISQPRAITVSALERQNFDVFLQEVEKEVEKSRKIVKLSFSFDEYHNVAKLLDAGCVLSKEFLDDRVEVEALLTDALKDFYTSYEV
ncbi:GTPase HflX [Candidatus Clavichlamydia salmonicola]|uniref:GTPase HflX n=1 Tax=Candidatus Clavichlamydia salmonicola TaxID=469812 RepID=UPI001E2D85E4|nr:GTPase HflX [Candidatus Clavichlamydia salmonicola]